jgi:hypothetical protein
MQGYRAQPNFTQADVIRRGDAMPWRRAHGLAALRDNRATQAYGDIHASVNGRRSVTRGRPNTGDGGDRLSDVAR